MERVVLNALAKDAALPPDICAFGDSFTIAFGEVDPPLAQGGMCCPVRSGWYRDAGGPQRVSKKKSEGFRRETIAARRPYHFLINAASDADEELDAASVSLEA